MSVDDGLRPLFRKHLPHIDWTTIETGGTGRGVPDSNGCAGGVEFWVEYKATSGWDVTLRPEQIGWALRRVRHGGRVFVAVRRRNSGGPRRGPPVDELWLFDGGQAMEARRDGLRAVAMTALVAHGGPSAWDWRAISTRLLGQLRPIPGT